MQLLLLKILLVEDNPADARLVQELLRRGELSTPSVTSAAELGQALDLLRESNYGAIVLDLGLPDSQGLETFVRVHAQAPDVPILVLSGLQDEKLAMEAVAAGAQDYLVKGQLDEHILSHAIRNAIDRKEAEAKIRWLTRALDQSPASVVISNANGRIEYVNSRFTEVTGYSAREAIGRNPRFLKSGETPTETFRQLWSTILKDETWRGELLNRRKNGELFWNSLSISPIRNANGTTTHFVGVQEDITARRLAEETLRASEERFRSIFEQAAVGMAQVDARTGGFLRVNHKLCEILGYARDKLLSMGWTDVIHPDEVAAERQRLQVLALGGSHIRAHVERYVRRDGAFRWARVTPSQMEQPGDGRSVMKVVEDVTESHLSEEALRASEQRLATVFRLTRAGLIVVRLSDKKILDVNEAFLELVGWTREEVIGRTPLELELFSSPKNQGQLYEDLGSGGKLRALEVLIRRKSGDERNVLLTGTAAELGGKACVIGALHDITEMRRSDAARLESEQRFRQLVEGMREVFWLTNPEKNRILYISSGYESIWGRTCQSLYDSPIEWAEAIHPDDRERVLQAWGQAFGKYEIEYRIVRPEGVARWIRARASPVVDDSGKIVSIAGVAEDITERRGLEDQLRQAQKLEAIGSLAGGVAHDFNNILSVILTYAELLIGDLEPGSPMRKDLEEIKNAGQRAADLTRQLLAFSRQQILQPRVLDLNQIIAGMEKMLRRLIGEDVELSVIPSPSPARVNADPGQMEQVLMNLAVNARDAMPEGGRLMIEVGEKLLDESYASKHGIRPGPHVMLAVSDNGTGMDAATQARVFEPFFTTKEIGKGTGLGLSTVFGIVRQSRGSICVYSEPGKGSTFKVYLPTVAQDIGAAVQLAPQPAVLGGSETILLVEDDEGVRKVARAILERNGYRVFEAQSGGDALIILEQNSNIDLLLTDVVMPRMSGAHLVARLHQVQPKLKVVYMSGYTDNAVVLQGVLHAEVPFVQKPITPVGLLARIREVLDSPTAPRPP